MSLMESNLIKCAKEAVEELKEGKKQLYVENNVNYYFSEYKIVNTLSSRVILLIILRGEHPVVIPIKLVYEYTAKKVFVEEIKEQIKKFFSFYDDKFPNYFSISELLEYDEEMRKWFYGFEAKLVCNNCSRAVILKQSHFEKFSKKLNCKAEEINPDLLRKLAEKQNLLCNECKSKDVKLNIN